MGARRTRGTDMTALDFGVEDARYRAWLTHAFDRPATPKGWYFDSGLAEEEFKAGHTETVGLIGRTLARCGTDLAGFSDAQVYHGLNYMVSEIHGRAASFGVGAVPVDNKVAAIRAMKHLYKDCLEPRCAPCLGHLSERAGTPLNTLAYMLWDISPIFSLNHHVPAIAAAWLEVMRFALGSPNEACVEGALHGLGHAEMVLPALIHPTIDTFLASTRDADVTASRGAASALRPVRQELRAYARRARSGRIL